MNFLSQWAAWWITLEAKHIPQRLPLFPLERGNAVPANSTSSTLPASLLGQIACIWEVIARKAGNVHPRASFADLAATDFLLSAAAVGPLLDDALQRGVGATILEAVRRT